MSPFPPEPALEEAVVGHCQGDENRLGQFVTDGRKDVQGGKAGDIPDVIPDDDAVCAVVNDCYTNEPNKHDTRDEGVGPEEFLFHRRPDYGEPARNGGDRRSVGGIL